MWKALDRKSDFVPSSITEKLAEEVTVLQGLLSIREASVYLQDQKRPAHVQIYSEIKVEGSGVYEVLLVEAPMALSWVDAVNVACKSQTATSNASSHPYLMLDARCLMQVIITSWSGVDARMEDGR